MSMNFSCTGKPGSDDFEKAKKELQKSNFKEAIFIFHKITRQFPKDEISLAAAREAAPACEKEKTCEYHDYFLNIIMRESTNEDESVKAQSDLAFYYYDKGMYLQAIQTMNVLLSKPNFKEKRNNAILKLARSYFYIKNFFQSEVELKTYLKSVLTDEEKFEGYLLKADIQSAEKKFVEAANTYKEIKEKFKDLYLKNQVYMSEALMFEDQKQLDQAIITLDSVKNDVSNKEFVVVKIERLKERRALMPGASGLKR